jgi:hypothetical protein
MNSRVRISGVLTISSAIESGAWAARRVGGAAEALVEREMSRFVQVSVASTIVRLAGRRARLQLVSMMNSYKRTGRDHSVVYRDVEART